MVYFPLPFLALPSYHLFSTFTYTFPSMSLVLHFYLSQLYSPDPSLPSSPPIPPFPFSIQLITRDVCARTCTPIRTHAHGYTSTGEVGK